MAGQSVQEPLPDGVAATRLAEAVAPLKPAAVRLPAGNGAWSVRVIRTGGFAGVKLDMSLSSAGGLKCESTITVRCPNKLSADALQPVALLLDPKILANVPASSLTDSCRDCFVTRITVQRRESDGKTRTYFAYWDDVTAARVPPELVKLANSVVSMSK